MFEILVDYVSNLFFNFLYKIERHIPWRIIIINIVYIMTTDFDKRKLALYEKFFDEMKIIEEEEVETLTKIEIMKTNNIDDNYVYLDEVRDFKDLALKDQQLVNEQNKLYYYEKIKGKVDNVKNLFSMGSYIFTTSKWIPFNF